MFCLADVAVEFFKPDADCDLSDYGEEKSYQVDDEPEPELYESAPHEDGKCIYSKIGLVYNLSVRCSLLFVCLFMLQRIRMLGISISQI